MAKGSACIEKINCPDCSVQPNTHLQTFLNEDKALGMTWYTSFCMGECHAQKGDPYGEKVAPKVVVKSKEDLQAETDLVQNCPPFKPRRNYRGIPPEYFKSWSCRIVLSEYDGVTPYAIAFPLSDYGKLVGWKARPLKKKNFFAIGRNSNTDPFGFARAMALGGDTLYVTEGEFDAIALDYCLCLVGKLDRYPVISLTHGGGSLSKNFSYIESRILNKYKHIVLVLDDDEVGHLAEEAAQDLWGNKVVIVEKPFGSKDANEAVENGKAIEMGNLALNFKRR